MGLDLKAKIKDAGHQTLGIQTATKPLTEELSQWGAAADLGLLVRFGLGELLVNGDDDGHREVVAGLIVTNQYLLNFADGDTSEFDWSSRAQALKRCIEVEDVLLYGAEKALRGEDEQSGYAERQANDEERADSSRVCFLAHKINRLVM